MKITRLMATAAATVFMATVGTAGAPIANSAPTGPPYPVVGKLGDELTMTDTVGQVQLSWRVSSLKPGSDVMPGYRVDGNLWEATATVKAIRGSVTPAVSQFNAVAPNHAAYRVLWFVASPVNITGGTIPQGTEATGKIHFDVTGPAPTTVTMNNGMEDLMVWGP